MHNAVTVSLHCPQCRAPLAPVDEPARGLSCPVCNHNYPVVDGRPVLFRPDNEVFHGASYERRVSPAPSWRTRLKSLIPEPGVTLVKDEIQNELRRLLDRQGPATVLVIGSGLCRDKLRSDFTKTVAHTVVCTDVDPRADVDIFCDGHDLPFADGAFNAVIIIAVLEHVLYPERVVSEIARVLKRDGLVYSAIPFMQQVHEGAYDFTRYTHSGHRRLFRQFREIRSGMVSGPGTALVWAIEHFAMAFFSQRRLRQGARLAARCLFFWLKYCDYVFARHPESMDGASGTYFLGSKALTAVADIDIIRGYVGATDFSSHSARGDMAKF